MVAVVLRLVLLLSPIVAVIFWLRWRAARKADPQALNADVRTLMKRLGMIALMALMAALGVYFSDGQKAPAGQVYIPPHMENGVLVPGRFVDQAEADRLKALDKALEDEAAAPNEDTAEGDG